MQAADFGFALGFGDVSFAVVGLLKFFIDEANRVSDVQARTVLTRPIAFGCRRD